MCRCSSSTTAEITALACGAKGQSASRALLCRLPFWGMPRTHHRWPRGPPFDQAAAVLTAAYGRIGDVRLEEAAGVLCKGGDVAGVWARPGPPSPPPTPSPEGGGRSGTHPPVGPRREPDGPRPGRRRPPDLGRRRPARKRIDPWQAVTLGLTLRLPTFAEYRQRVATLTEGLGRAKVQAQPLDSQRSLIAGRPIPVAG